MRSETSPKSCRAYASTRMPSCSICASTGHSGSSMFSNSGCMPCSRRPPAPPSGRRCRPSGWQGRSCGAGLVRRRDVQISPRQLRQGVGPARRIEQIGRHGRVEHDPRRLPPEVAAHAAAACCRARSSARPPQTGRSSGTSPFRAFAAQHIGRLVRAVHVRCGHEHREIVRRSNAERTPDNSGCASSGVCTSEACRLSGLPVPPTRPCSKAAAQAVAVDEALEFQRGEQVIQRPALRRRMRLFSGVKSMGASQRIVASS